MEFKHEPVMLNQCIDGLNIKQDGIYADGTLGGGGHSSAICDSLSPEGTLIGIDTDKDALKAAGEKLQDKQCRIHLINSNYADIKDVLADLEIEKIDGALLDLGVSSFQLDNPERGFSYMNDAPLDMRMDQEGATTARDVVNTYSKRACFRNIQIW